MPESSPPPKPSALETARAWSARAREQQANQPSWDERCNRVSRLLCLWRGTLSVGEEPSDFDRHLDALVEFGCAVREAGWQSRVDQLAPGPEDRRHVAVEFLRLVVAGERKGIADLDRQLRVTSEGFDVLVLADELVVHEVLGIARRVRTPPNWEGHPPEREVCTVEGLLAWFDQQLALHDFLSAFPHWSDDGAVLRNARRVMDELNIFCDIPRAVGQMSCVEVENQLRDLKTVCQRFMAEQTQQDGSKPNETSAKAKLGRKLSSDPAKDREFAAAWERAKSVGVQFKDFCKDQKLTLKKGKAILARERMRKK